MITPSVFSNVYFHQYQQNEENHLTSQVIEDNKRSRHRTLKKIVPGLEQVHNVTGFNWLMRSKPFC